MKAVNQKKLIAYYLILAILFGGILIVTGSYLDSYMQVWNIPIWGRYVVLNLVLSIGGALAVTVGFIRTSTGRYVLLGLTAALIFLDIQKISLDIAAYGTGRSHLTLVLPVLIAHAYLIFVLIKSFFFERERG